MDQCRECGRALRQGESLWCEPCIQAEEEADEAEAMKVIVHCAECGIKDSEPCMYDCDECQIYLCPPCWRKHECDGSVPLQAVSA